MSRWVVLLFLVQAILSTSALATVTGGEGNQEYRHRMRLEVANHDADPLRAGYSVSVVLDHAALVAAGASLADGADVRIAYADGDSWRELDRAADLSAGWGRSSTRVWFKTVTEIPAGGTDGNYYLYYGNTAATVPPYDLHFIVSETTLRDKLRVFVDKVLADNHTFFTDGTDYWRAAPGYVFAFAADTWYAFTGYPDYFSPEQIRNFFTKIIQARDANGDFPIALQTDGSPYVYYSAWDGAQRHVTGDGNLLTPMMEKLYYDKSGDIAPFLSTAPFLKTALSHIPRDLYSKLVTIDPGDEWVPWGFQDAVRKTGNELMGSLLYYQASKDMATLYAAAGDMANANFFGNEASDIKNNISVLWDHARGMFFGASGEKGHQIDVEGSAYAVYVGITTPQQALDISRYLVNNYDTLTGGTGYIRQSPDDWGYSYYIGSETPGMYGSGLYDNGRWSVANEWVATALKLTSPEKAVQYVTEYIQGPDPTLEYLGIGVEWNGAPSNLESPMGAWKFLNDNRSLFTSGTTVKRTDTADFSNVFTFWDDFSVAKAGWSNAVGVWSPLDGVMQCANNSSSGDTKLAYDVGLNDNVLMQADFKVNSYSVSDYSTIGVCLNSTDTGYVDARGYCSAFRATDPFHSFILDEEVVWGEGNPFSWGTGVWYRTKIARIGPILYRKIWEVGSEEPTEWQETYRQSNDLSSTGISLLTSHSDSQFDNLLVRPYVLHEPTVNVVSVPPETFLSLAPESIVNRTSATFGFGSSEFAALFECSLDGGGFSGCTSPTTLDGLSEGSHTFAVRAKDAWGVDPSPVSYTWIVDASPPDTLLSVTPPAHVPAPGVTFTFTSPDPSATFECGMDRPSVEFAACTSPYLIPSLPNGSHTFAVRARDRAGNIDGTPAAYTFTVNIPGGNIKVGGNHYGRVAEGVGAALDGDVVMLRDMEFAEDVVLNRPDTLTVRGGYDQDFLSSSGATHISGAIAVTRGTVTVDRIVIR